MKIIVTNAAKKTTVKSSAMLQWQPIMRNTLIAAIISLNGWVTLTLI